ncbi:hypothetical protein D9611_009841 [Ephemerocybe angulata]|uniref:F-box domain-containing protein n=1 Tax=Ephemerocybe angulata TaxID=980116 RepID=A0A8H5CEQ4_9AGAR|nr:hypothetical protein D9611_009841 [Tulosesus angulatus]
MASAQAELDDRIVQLERQLKDELISMKRRRNGMSPVSKLFPELLSKIFSISTIGDWDPPTEKQDRRQAGPYRRGCIIISQVSWSWRTIALGSPDVWARIRIRTTTKNRLVKYMMKNASQVPLSVDYNCKEYGPLSGIIPDKPRALNMIKEILARAPMKTLIFRPSHPPVFNELLPLFPSKSDVIQVLEVYSYPLHRHGELDNPTQEDFFAQGAPYLRRLVVRGHVFIPWTSALLTQSPYLTFLELNTPSDTTIHQIYQAIGNNTRLQHLKLILPDNMKISEGVLDTEPRTSQETISLPDLHTLQLTGNLSTLVAILSLVEIPASIETFVLSVAVPRGDQPNLLPGFHTLLAASERARWIGLSEDPSQRLLVSPQVFKVTGYMFTSYSIEASTWEDQLDEPFSTNRQAPKGHTSITWVDGDRTRTLFDPNEWGRYFPFSFTRNTDGVWESYGWSLGSITAFEAGADVPESLWNIISTLPQLKHLSLSDYSARTASSFISGDDHWDANPARAADGATIPFPDLQTIVVETRTDNQRHGITSQGHFFHINTMIARLLYGGLVRRQHFLASRGVYASEGGGWRLRRIEMRNCVVPMDQETSKMLSFMSHDVVWTRRSRTTHDTLFGLPSGSLGLGDLESIQGSDTEDIDA